MEEKRFKGVIGDKLEMINLSMHHHDRFQEEVSRLVGDYTAQIEEKQPTVLEIGCGSGLTSEKLLSMNSDINLTAIDNDPVLLNKSKDNLRNYILEGRLSHKLADALTYVNEEKNEQYNVVVTVFVFHNFKKNYREKIIQQLYRILKPRGLFIIADKVARRNVSEHHKDLVWQLRQFKIYDQIDRPDLKAAWTKHYHEDDASDRIMKYNELVSSLIYSGFEEKKINQICREHMEIILTAKK